MSAALTHYSPPPPPPSNYLSSPFSLARRVFAEKGGSNLVIPNQKEKPRDDIFEEAEYSTGLDAHNIVNKTSHIDDDSAASHLVTKMRDQVEEVRSPDTTLSELMVKRSSKSLSSKPLIKTLRNKRPTKLMVPEICSIGYDDTNEDEMKQIFGGMKKKLENEEFEMKGRDFCLATKKGRRESMEDSYSFMLDILGDPKQAYFAVVDGHGGGGAAEYVAENLGKNIMKAFDELEEEEEESNMLEMAIRRGYQLTDTGFLSQGKRSGACAASVILREGEMHVANVGDCRVVLCRNGVSHVLTQQHRLSDLHERLRIQNSGGFVDCRNGIWRVEGSLAVSRAFGDLHFKNWVISDPHILRLPLTPDSLFLILASDGLWDLVNDQEAVDMIMKEFNDPLKCCKMLIDLSSSRGNTDDITVMVIDLHNYVSTSEAMVS